MQLLELGFNDRLGIICINKFFEEKGKKIEGLATMSYYLGNYYKEIIEKLEYEIPILSFRKTKRNLDYILS